MLDLVPPEEMAALSTLRPRRYGKAGNASLRRAILTGIEYYHRDHTNNPESEGQSYLFAIHQSFLSIFEIPGA